MDEVPDSRISKQKDSLQLFMENLWFGDLGLATTYWVYGVLGGIVWGIAIFALKPDPQGDLILVLWSLFACYYFVVYVGVWRSATKYVGNKIWTVLAKFAVIIVVLPVAINFFKWLAAD
ncbi:MAG: Uncharacterized protein AWT59_1370 [Candidatus Gallionella acididurans]|uniref:Transmembrane protein n=1 Tax=Candidatus Gallionella acididurans TaxID=1796491 RepID=A0A139BU88_9PROT|nr:MAG: Uncharacterized protein AWT59_1370 [Candidatus Gallionella acididurans]